MYYIIDNSILDFFAILIKQFLTPLSSQCDCEQIQADGFATLKDLNVHVLLMFVELQIALHYR